MTEMGSPLACKTGCITVRTFAEGMLARLAHDLELEWRVADGTATIEAAQVTARLRIAADAVTVVGVRKNGALDRDVLSTGERADIKKKLLSSIGADRQDAVIRAEITIEGARTSDRAVMAPLPAKVLVELPCGRATATADVHITTSDGVTHATGTLNLSLRALDIPEIKGPLGAFRLKDKIELAFKAEFS